MGDQSDFDPVFVHALATQSWSLYVVGMFLVILRMCVFEFLGVSRHLLNLKTGMRGYIVLGLRGWRKMTIL